MINNENKTETKKKHLLYFEVYTQHNLIGNYVKSIEVDNCGWLIAEEIKNRINSSGYYSRRLSYKKGITVDAYWVDIDMFIDFLENINFPKVYRKQYLHIINMVDWLSQVFGLHQVEPENNIMIQLCVEAFYNDQTSTVKDIKEKLNKLNHERK